MCYIVGPGRILRFVLANGDCGGGDNVEFDPKRTQPFSAQR